MKWDILERKERLPLEKHRGGQKLVAHCSGEGWGSYGCSNSGFRWVFLTGHGFEAFSVELVWFAPLLGEGNNLESILLISPVADLYLFRMQECRPPSPQDAGMTLPFMGDGILICLRLSDPTIRGNKLRVYTF
jgi:hypothetical protein